MAEEPLDSLAVGAVAEFAGQLEYPGGAEWRHTDAAASAVDLGVAVLGGSGGGCGGGRPSHGELHIGVGGGGGCGCGGCGGGGFGVRLGESVVENYF